VNILNCSLGGPFGRNAIRFNSANGQYLTLGRPSGLHFQGTVSSWAVFLVFNGNGAVYTKHDNLNYQFSFGTRADGRFVLAIGTSAYTASNNAQVLNRPVLVSGTTEFEFRTDHLQFQLHTILVSCTSTEHAISK
jgi:hypothetical protein